MIFLSHHTTLWNGIAWNHTRLRPYRRVLRIGTRCSLRSAPDNDGWLLRCEVSLPLLFYGYADDMDIGGRTIVAVFEQRQSCQYVQTFGDLTINGIFSIQRRNAANCRIGVRCSLLRRRCPALPVSLLWSVRRCCPLSWWYALISESRKSSSLSCSGWYFCTAAVRAAKVVHRIPRRQSSSSVYTGCPERCRTVTYPISSIHLVGTTWSAECPFFVENDSEEIRRISLAGSPMPTRAPALAVLESAEPPWIMKSLMTRVKSAIISPFLCFFQQNLQVMGVSG